ncbi:AAA family ATPase [Trinickia mobilis]|uniref:AAA family ATPase n=1 Tax=Trinickia mobilis TaxID=2816356 RepID=UPI001A8C9D88|nr:ATP-binding protein [Trinickia mobilis]
MPHLHSQSKAQADPSEDDEDEGEDEDNGYAIPVEPHADNASVPPGSAFDEDAAVQLLCERLTEAEESAGDAAPPEILAVNMQRLQALVGLSDAETRILTFGALVHTDRVLDLMSDWVGDLTSAKLFHVLSAVLDISEKTVRAALSPQGALARSGLLTVDRKQRWNVAAKLDLLSDSFADQVVSDVIDPVDLLRGMVTLAPRATLSMVDFAHLGEQLTLMRSYFERVSLTRRRGANVLVYGEPGTGKTELTRMLARALRLSLYEVTGGDEEGDAVLGDQRLRAFRAAQAFFTEQPVLIVFDEAEDVFSDGGPNERSVARTRKAWLNRALEDNPVPTLWLSNSVAGLDPAFVRRFDMVLQMPLPPSRMRERIIHAACGSHLLDSTAYRISRHSALTPGVVARAAAVLLEVADDWPPERFNETLERLVSGTLKAQGHASLSQITAAPPTGAYDLAYVNVDADLPELARGVIRTRSARLCLYGPPGTGKTAFSAWLADEMDVPLLSQRASDLISPFVGETERNIALAFEEAARDGALLCVDEADSFLRDRAGSRYGWEVTAVNEMLTQIANFTGVLVMSTNLLNALDEAALRRFDVKLHFDYLSTQQRRALFADRCGALGLGVPDAECERQLARLDTLTPGEFASVIRRHRLSPLRSPADFARALAAECNVKQRGAAPIGFV